MLRRVLISLVALLVGACASLGGREPVQVSLVGVEPLPGQGLEVRMLVKLRVQNPNDAAIDYNGVSLKLDVQGRPFATGVSDASGSVPRFGEAVIGVPVSVSAMSIARQAMGAMSNEFRGKVAYEMNGKIAGPAFGGVSFANKGEIELPAEVLRAP